MPAQMLVRETVKNYPGLLAIKIYVPGTEPTTTRLIASKDEKEIGQPAAKSEQAVISHGEPYYGKEKDSISVIMPLCDRNIDAFAPARVVMRPFPGHTEQNAIARALRIVKEMQ